eukprot:7190229-Lingulodinium_polyedra.AAC.1
MEKLDRAVAENQSQKESLKAPQKQLNDVFVGRSRFQKAVNEHGPERAQLQSSVRSATRAMRGL